MSSHRRHYVFAVVQTLGKPMPTQVANQPTESASLLFLCTWSTHKQAHSLQDRGCCE